MLCLFGVLTQIVINYSFTSLCIFVSANCLFLIICFLKCTLSIVSKCVLSNFGKCIKYVLFILCLTKCLVINLYQPLEVLS